MALAVASAAWAMFGNGIVRDTLSEAVTEALGAQVDIGSAKVRLLETSVELRSFTLADPFDRTRNLFEADLLSLELEPRPLLEKKFVIRRITVGGVRTGTQRRTPARAVTGAGLASRAMTEVQRLVGQFDIPSLALRNLGELKDVVVDPRRLRAVQTATLVAQRADSTRRALGASFANLQLEATLDSSRAVVARLQGVNVRTLGLEGARRAIADVRQAAARVDSARARVDGLLTLTRRGIDSLQAGVAAIDTARRADYKFASDLLRVPTLDGPDLGGALFGKVTIDRFQQAAYWATLARHYAPPGLLPRETNGPKRLRRAGTTVHFATPRSYPRFLLRRTDVDVTVPDGPRAGRYVFAASDVTTDPGIIGKPMLFALRRAPQGGGNDSLRAIASIDHVNGRRREVMSVQAAGLQLPKLPIPALPYTLDPGRGSSEMRFLLDGDRISGRWIVRSRDLTWRPDSARQRSLNQVETLLARVLTGIPELDLAAEIGGTLTEPTLQVRSNLDRQLSERLKAVMGEEIAAAQARVRAQVDRYVDEKSAPVKAQIAEIRSEGERRVAQARAELDEEKRRLEERLKALTGGMVNLPRLPGD